MNLNGIVKSIIWFLCALLFIIGSINGTIHSTDQGLGFIFVILIFYPLAILFSSLFFIEVAKMYNDKL